MFTSFLKICLSICLLTLSTASFAQDADERIVSAAEFEAMSTGKTLYFSQNGAFFGAEQYYTRRRSLWVNSAGECVNGVWFEQDGYICFDYDQGDEPACWHFLETPRGFMARHKDSSNADFDLLLYNTDTTPLKCTGPAIGA